MTRKEYYVAMHIDGKCVDSSALANGTLTKCREVVGRVMRQKDKHKSITWHIYECAGVVDSPASSRYVE